MSYRSLTPNEPAYSCRQIVSNRHPTEIFTNLLLEVFEVAAQEVFFISFEGFFLHHHPVKQKWAWDALF